MNDVSELDIAALCERAVDRKRRGVAFNMLPDTFLSLADEILRRRRADKGIASDLIVGLTELSDALESGDLSKFRITRIARKPGM